MLESDVICKVACGGVEPKFVSWGTTVKVIKSGNIKNYALLNKVLCYELGLLFGVYNQYFDETGRRRNED